MLLCAGDQQKQAEPQAEADPGSEASSATHTQLRNGMALMAFDILGALRNLLSQADADGGPGEADPIEAPGIRPTDPPTTEAEPVDPAAAPAEPATINDALEPEAGAGVTDPAQNVEAETGETLPASEVSEAELRDSAVNLGTENERLRNLVIDLGGNPDPEDEIIDPEADPAPEYDDDAATADIAAQKAQIAALLGNA